MIALPVRAALAACAAIHVASLIMTPVHAARPDSLQFGADSVLTLTEARARTLASHPALASSRSLVEAAQRRRTDAGRRPNPVLSGEVENFGNSSDSDRRETTVQLGQTFELGGDRKARSLVAK